MKNDELNRDLLFLVDIALLVISDDRPAVANHAAYNVARYARYVSDPIYVDRVISAFRRLSRDPRMNVRGASAFGGAMLKQLAIR